MNSYEKIKKIVQDMENDIKKFNGGTGAAGTRARKSYKEIMDLAKEARKEVQEIKNKRASK